MRVVRAEFWAEDGGIFVGEGLQKGLSSLLLPYGGSYHTIQRLIALCSIKLFPLLWLPNVLSLASLLIFVAVVSRISSREYEWLIPSARARLLTAVAICLAPGLGEMLGNLANLNWIFFLWLALLGLKDPSKELGLGQLLIAGLVVLSIGTSVLLIPLFAWRIFSAIHSGKRGSILAREATALGLILSINFWLVVHHAERPEPLSAGSLTDLLRIYFVHFVSFGFLQPWFGDKLADWIADPRNRVWFALAAAAFLLAIAVWISRRHLRPARVALLLLFSGVSAWTILCCFARENVMHTLELPLGSDLRWHRYAFPLTATAILFWMGVLRPPSEGIGLRSTAAFFLILSNLLAAALFRFHIGSYGATRYWPEASQRIQAAMKDGCPAQVLVPTYPAGSSFTYSAPHPNRSCVTSR